MRYDLDIGAAAVSSPPLLLGIALVCAPLVSLQTVETSCAPRHLQIVVTSSAPRCLQIAVTAPNLMHMDIEIVPSAQHLDAAAVYIQLGACDSFVS